MANAAIESLTQQVSGLIGFFVVALEKIEEVEKTTERIEGTIGEKVQTVLEQVTVASGKISSDVTEVEERVSTMTRSVTTSLSETTNAAGEARSEVESIIEEMLNRSATSLDDLKNILERSTSEFDKELLRQIELIELGLLKISDLDKAFQNAQINGQSLIQFLQGVDIGVFEQDIQRLTNLLQRNRVKIEEVYDFLEKRGGELGQSIASWVKELQEGNITTERFRTEIRRLLKTLEDFGADTAGLQEFLDQIEQLLQNDSATG